MIYILETIDHIWDPTEEPSDKAQTRSPSTREILNKNLQKTPSDPRGLTEYIRQTHKWFWSLTVVHTQDNQLEPGSFPGKVEESHSGTSDLESAGGWLVDVGLAGLLLVGNLWGRSIVVVERLVGTEENLGGWNPAVVGIGRRRLGVGLAGLALGSIVVVRWNSINSRLFGKERQEILRRGLGYNLLLRMLLDWLLHLLRCIFGQRCWNGQFVIHIMLKFAKPYVLSLDIGLPFWNNSSESREICCGTWRKL